MSKELKKNLIYFVVILVFSLIVFIPWLSVHYSLDNYTIENYGYSLYSNKWSLLGGRFIMFGILHMANIINLPTNLFIVICEILAICISCANVLILKSMIQRIKNTNSKLKDVLLTIICYISIFNFMFIDCMEYVECVVMALSVMLYLLSAWILTQKNRGSILKSIVLTLLGMFCYQGTVCIFFTFTTLFSILRNKDQIRKIIKDIVICGVISLVTVLLNMAFIKVAELLVSAQQNRISSITNIWDNLENCVLRGWNIIINSCGLFPKYMFIAILLALTISVLLYAYRNKLNNSFLINYFILIIVAIISTFLFFIMTKSSFYTGRMRLSIGSLIGLIFLYLYVNDALENNKYFSLILSLFLTIYTLTTIIMYEFTMISKNITNCLEKKEAEEIENYINIYEEQNNTKITNVVEVLNIKHPENAYYFGQKNLGPSALKHCQIANSVIYVYTGRKLKYEGLIKRPNNTVTKKFYEQGYECQGDTLFIEVNIT